MDFSPLSYRVAKGCRRTSISGRFLWERFPVTAPLASGSAFVALVPVSLPLVRPGKQPGMSQLPSSRQPSLHVQQSVLCSQGRRYRHRPRCPCPWGARPVGRAGRARCRGRGGHRRPHGLHFAVWLRREAGGSASSPQVRRLGGREEPLAPAPPAPLAPPRGSAAAPALLRHRSGTRPQPRGVDGAPGNAPGAAAARGSGLGRCPAEGGAACPRELHLRRELPWRCGAGTSSGGLGRSGYRDTETLAPACSSTSPEGSPGRPAAGGCGSGRSLGRCVTALSRAGQRQAGPLKAAGAGAVPAGLRCGTGGVRGRAIPAEQPPRGDFSVFTGRAPAQRTERGAPVDVSPRASAAADSHPAPGSTRPVPIRGQRGETTV